MSRNWEFCPTFFRFKRMPLPLTGLLIFSFLQSGCQNVSNDSGFQVEQASCQSCHLSPPNSGMHNFHLFEQSASYQISCKDCHGGSIIKMPWIHEFKRNYPRNLGGYQKLKVSGDSLYLDRVIFQEREYNLCEARISNDSLYVGNLDSLTFTGYTIGPLDKIVWSDSGFEHHPLDSVNSADSLIYLNPVFYNTCGFKLKGKEIYTREIGPVNHFIAIIPKVDYTLYEDNQKFVARVPAFDQKYIINYNLKSVVEPPFDDYPEDILEEFSTFIKGKGRFFLLSNNGTLSQIKEDTLYTLEKDSSLDYDNLQLTTTSSLHGNGKLDIEFYNMEHTYYKQRLVSADTDNISGDTTRLIYQTLGAWNPIKKTCWSSGVYNNGSCHTKTFYETPWYPEHMSLTPP